MRLVSPITLIAILTGSCVCLNAQIEHHVWATPLTPVQLIIDTDQIFDNSMSEFNPGYLNQGFWATDIPHYAYDLNFGSEGAGRRGYVTFDLSSLQAPVSSAVLRFTGLSWSGISPFDILFYDVSTNAAVLNQGNQDYVPGVFDDLGSGNVYARLALVNNTGSGSDFSGSFQTIDIPLSSQAVADINAAQGGFFSVGADADPVPEPSTFGLAGVAVVVLLFRRRCSTCRG